jgi:uncharacterized membrane protein YgcG
MPVVALQTVLEIFFLGVPVGTTVRLSELKTNKIQNAGVISKVASSLQQDLVKDGYIEPTFTTQGRWRRFTIIALGIVFMLYMQDVVVTCMVLCCLAIPLIANYRRRTVLGYEALNYLKGFKLFLSVTETERYKFFNAPAKNPEVFMQYLPYAIAFGVEKEWADAFAGISIPNPGWYDGGSMQTFSALALTSDLGSFSSTFAASSGTGGSSGGGFSGGGGGGGGGGGW